MRLVAACRGERLASAQWTVACAADGCGGRCGMMDDYLFDRMDDPGADRCEHCNREMTLEERALNWPTFARNGLLICPSCYGDEAYCARCGALLDAHADVSTCDTCLRQMEVQHADPLP
jgi:hypothetical protein